jgi:hypothetical protein
VTGTFAFVAAGRVLKKLADKAEADSKAQATASQTPADL